MTVQPTRDQLRALADAATPGPWEADHSEEDNSSVKERGREWWDGLAFAGRPADAEFIAAARTAVPQLLDALTRAEARSGIRGRAVQIYQARARDAEQRLADVESIVADLEQEPFDQTSEYANALLGDLRHALSPHLGSPDESCGLGICALGDGHDGPCRC